VYSDTLFSHVDRLAILGHYHLWVGGVEHNDVSVKNLMYDKCNGDRGVLNDYDLSHLAGGPRPSGTERTGTMPFMAFDLLTDEAWDGKITRLYRHDCESFAWVLLWICCRYEDGKEIHNPPLGQFITGSYNQCFLEKHAITSKLKYLTATSSYDSFWFAVVDLLDLFIMQQQDRERAALPRKSSPPELTINEIVEKCQKVLEQSGFPVALN
jgi:Fungal protein kinase